MCPVWHINVLLVVCMDIMLTIPGILERDVDNALRIDRSSTVLRRGHVLENMSEGPILNCDVLSGSEPILSGGSV